MSRSAYTNVVPIPGMVPFPLLLAVIFDTACEVFQYKCGEKGSCWVYDSDYLATGLAIWVVCIKLLSTSMYFLGENRSFITFHMFMFSTHVRVLQTCVWGGGGGWGVCAGRGVIMKHSGTFGEMFNKFTECN